MDQNLNTGSLTQSLTHYSILSLSSHFKKQLYNLISVSMDLPILDISYKWNHMLCGLLWLASLTKHHVFKVHPCCSVCQCFTPFHGWVIFCYMDGPRFVYPVICWWTFELFLIGGEGNGGWLLNRYGVSFWGDKCVWELDSGDVCTTLWMC